MSLEEYYSKRNFGHTPEPRGERSSGGDEGRFVVQRHDATRLHYDLRLEIDGTLKSWAVPKGPSMNPEDSRLAVRTEDHPVQYLHFEGEIPRGNYGAGDMKIWDQGRFHAINTSPAGALEAGKLSLYLEGEQLRGRFSLLRTGMKNGKEQWLLRKKEDAFSTSQPYDAEDQKPRETGGPFSPIRPMLAGVANEAFNDADWLFETKWDGYRLIAHIEAGQVELRSRNGVNYSDKFASLQVELAGIPQQVILDGEVVLFDEAGRQDFQGLQNYEAEGSGELHFYVFDLLYLNGHSTLELKLLERKELLRDLLPDEGRISYLGHTENMGKTCYEKAVEKGYEGIIAKRKDSRYRPGQRSEHWLKIKQRKSMEALICGYTASDSARPFGSLLLGYPTENGLQYRGRVGTGFNEQQQRDILEKLAPLKTDKSPFASEVNTRGDQLQWLKPELVAEVYHSELTSQGRLRHPVFKALRDDVEMESGGQQESPGNSLEVGPYSVPLSNLSKLFWPEEGLRKYELIDYYIAVGGYMLPHLKDRPQSLHRHPDGIHGESFFQKDQSGILPHWVESLKLSSGSSGKEIRYLLCQNEASLIYMANLGCIEIHPWNSRAGHLEKPDYTVVDLDPSPENSFEDVIEVAQAFQELLKLAEIEAFVKTTGSIGLHIYLPLGAQYSYEQAREFTRLLCHYVQEKIPGLTTLERSLKKRNGRIYLDYLQNRQGQTLAAAYCLRPVPGATVSAPLRWEELKQGLQLSDFNIHNMPARLEELGDIFTPAKAEPLDMSAAIDRLDALDNNW